MQQRLSTFVKTTAELRIELEKQKNALATEKRELEDLEASS